MKQRIQKILFLHMILFFLLIPGVQASQQTSEAAEAVSPQELLDSQIDTLNIDELKKFWEEISNEYGGFLPESQKGSLYEFIKGDKKFSFKEWATGAMKFVFHEFIVNGKLLGASDGIGSPVSCKWNKSYGVVGKIIFLILS